MARPSTSRTWPFTRARPPPRSSSRRVMTSNVRQPLLRDVQAEHRRVRVRAERVNVVQHQMLQLRAFGQQVRQHAVAQQVGDLVPVADRMQALRREIVGVIAAFARLRAPS